MLTTTLPVQLISEHLRYILNTEQMSIEPKIYDNCEILLVSHDSALRCLLRQSLQPSKSMLCRCRSCILDAPRKHTHTTV